MTDTGETRDEGFQAWLSLQETYLDEFFASDLPPMPDPYSQAGLRAAEAVALARFADIEAATADPESMSRFVRFIGQCFTVALGGHWTDRPTIDDGKPFLGIAFDWTSDTLNIPTLYTSAFARRTGEQWARVFGYQAEDRSETMSQS